ncbi:Scr1 family TA system antitoxin-like transcriptional regulator [[Kitasatospora] papulosa]|uniref:Scr1 family TA system antitoxin-like transcriptional regulator n=1 Tax=[Kitasatospora] papulosa TaxID=1464011 RepID=UPI00362BEC3A
MVSVSASTSPASQIDRLHGMIGMETVELGALPFHGIRQDRAHQRLQGPDDRLVVADDWHAELWLDDADNIALHKKVWKTLSESAVYGTDARNLINSARRSLNPVMALRVACVRYGTHPEQA